MGLKTPRNMEVQEVTPRDISQAANSLSACALKSLRVLGIPRKLRFPSVLLHSPPLAHEFTASYGEMSRRSGSAARRTTTRTSLRVFRG